jgi:hypothetical protein
LQFNLANGVVPLEYAHGFMAGSRQGTEIVVSFYPPIVNKGTPKIREGKILNPCLSASGNRFFQKLWHGSLKKKGTPIDKLSLNLDVFY